MVTSLSDTVCEQAQKVSGLLTDEADAVADLATVPARTAEEQAQQQAARAEDAAREQERETKRAERAAARDRQQARERYEGLTKAELSDQLAERGLPKTGTWTSSSTAWSAPAASTPSPIGAVAPPRGSRTG